MSAGHEHAAQTLKALDRDRYAASLVLPADLRPDVQALYAFNADVAAIRERVSEPAPGEIRLQWWIDAVEGEGHGAVGQNPLAAALFATIARHELPTGPLLRLLAARRFDLYGDPMPDIAQFEGYAGETTSILLQYAALILDADAAPRAADAAGHLGVAQALVGHLKAFGYNAARGQIFLPLSVFAAHGVDEGAILSGRSSPALVSALVQIAEMANDHADKARHAVKALPRGLRPAFAPLALVERDLVRLRGRRDAFAPPPADSDFKRLAALVWWTLRA